MIPIADSGLLVGYLDHSDQHHAWACECFKSLRTSLVTCEAVIAETEYLVPGSGPLLMEMIKRGTLQVGSILRDHAQAIGLIMERYPKMQFADACVVCLSEMERNAVVYTTDKRDFSIYRRRHNELIKIVTPDA